VAAGENVTCQVEPADAGQPLGATADALTFGYGLRPCPGPHHALALAAGVIDAIREHDQN
jgi:hypothetical protein